MIREAETGGLQLEEGKNGAQTNTDIGKKLKKARSLPSHPPEGISLVDNLTSAQGNDLGYVSCRTIRVYVAGFFFL